MEPLRHHHRDGLHLTILSALWTAPLMQIGGRTDGDNTVLEEVVALRGLPIVIAIAIAIRAFRRAAGQ